MALDINIVLQKIWQKVSSLPVLCEYTFMLYIIHIYILYIQHILLYYTYIICIHIGIVHIYIVLDTTILPKY